MADHTTGGNGIIPATITIVCGILAKLPFGVGDLAGFMSISVGLYTVYINWPNFKKRLKETFSKTKK